VPCSPHLCCEHDKLKRGCVLCRKDLVCEHEKARASCGICKPNLLCIHGKYRFGCAKCKLSYCEHEKFKSNCVVCRPNLICIHDKYRNGCSTCFPNLLCDHGSFKRHCSVCTIGVLCEHNIRKDCCRICTPSIICEHGINKRSCKVCSANFLICKHNRIKRICSLCEGKELCENCKFTRKSAKYKTYCSDCFYDLNPLAERKNNKVKTKEYCFREALIEYIDEDIDLIFDKKINNGCSLKRPDIRIERFSHTIILECDEEQHRSYEKICENKRIMELYQDLGNRPIVFLRFNPDTYVDEKGKKIKGCFDKDLKLDKKEWDLRIKTLVTQIDFYLKNVPTKSVTIDYFYYDENNLKK
jgi:hypothetical protein